MIRSTPAAASRAKVSSSAAKNGFDTPSCTYQMVSPLAGDTKARVRRGDVLVAIKLDRLARSLSHLLSVIAELDAKGAHFNTVSG